MIKMPSPTEESAEQQEGRDETSRPAQFIVHFPPINSLPAELVEQGARAARELIPDELVIERPKKSKEKKSKETSESKKSRGKGKGKQKQVDSQHVNNDKPVAASMRMNTFARRMGQQSAVDGTVQPKSNGAASDSSSVGGGSLC